LTTTFNISVFSVISKINIEQTKEFKWTIYIHFKIRCYILILNPLLLYIELFIEVYTVFNAIKSEATVIKLQKKLRAIPHFTVSREK